MKQIPCGYGNFALVDDTDYTWLIQYMWTTQDGYAVVDRRLSLLCQASMPYSMSENIYMHRLILDLQNEQGHEKGGDHRNHNRLDNQRDNLRVCTPSQNQGNRKLQENTTSQYKGVCWHKCTGKWLARICINNKKIHLGYFDNERTAAFAYNLAAKKYFKNFALLNKIG